MARTTVLSTRALNRALLERQMLLRRRRVSPLDALERLVGLQAQVPRDPYVALWSRLERFRPETIAEPLSDRRAVRMGLLRATLHLVTADDAIVLRPVLEPVVQRTLHGQRHLARALAGLDAATLVAMATRLLVEQPRTRAQLASLLGERWPERDAASLAYAVTYLMPLVQVTPRGLWGRTGPSAFTTFEHWLGRPPGPPKEPDDLMRRYLAAFGPSTPADASSWSRLAGMREVFERLRPELRIVRDERDRELFDVPRAPLPSPETPAPVRFLPEYDNVLLGHEDRSRIVPAGLSPLTEVGWGSVLVDGTLAARWKLERHDGSALLRVETHRPLTREDRDHVAQEGTALTTFLAPEADGSVVRIAWAPRGEDS